MKPGIKILRARVYEILSENTGPKRTLPLDFTEILGYVEELEDLLSEADYAGIELPEPSNQQLKDLMTAMDESPQ